MRVEEGENTSLLQLERIESVENSRMASGMECSHLFLRFRSVLGLSKRSGSLASPNMIAGPCTMISRFGHPFTLARSAPLPYKQDTRDNL